MTRKKTFAQIDSTEAVRSFVFPTELSEDQKRKASELLKIARRNSQGQITEEEKLSAELLQLRFQLEDYINNQEFLLNRRFGYFLKIYLQILKKKRIDFAREIDIHETLLSQLINSRRRPNENIMIRLELHSNKCIPADYWFRLVEKERIHEIKTNKRLRKEEKVHVSNRIPVRI
jgi:plasmid maintenance system antidote protein VapI